MDNIQKREIVTELKESYLDYAMSVIVSRALPDIRDGLKPVQRRVLYTMHELGLNHNAKFRKCAKITGDTTGNYHPHGTVSVYDTLARMAQDFSLRYPLVKGQGNFGSIDGDNPAAERYTEAKLSRIAEELMVDLEKETVDFQPNYDGVSQEPKVLPAKIPNLLLNGAVGIAVGMATNIPPHNLTEVVDATLHLIENPKASVEDLMNFIKGPDFPTGGVIYDRKAIVAAYSSGRGSFTARGVASIKERSSGKGSDIIITEIPYQVNKSEMVVKMAELVTDKKIEGIKDLRDESDREGLRVVVELKNDASPERILNQLYEYTDLQKDYHLNMIALVNGLQPQVLSLKDVLVEYVAHRKEVVVRRAKFDLRKAEERAHILEGLHKALSHIDAIIETIKKSADKTEAHKNLIKKFDFSPLQADAILELRLQSLAALERHKIEDELEEKRKLIAELKALLKSDEKIFKVIKTELSEVKEKYGDERRTKVVVHGLKDFKEEDLIPQEETIITMSNGGYIKRLPPDTFRSQKRGGKGSMGSDVADEDFLTSIIAAETHDNVLFFTNKGRVFQTKVWEIPQGSRISKGKPIHNFLDIPQEEAVSAVVCYPNQTQEKTKGFLVMTTEQGVIKKTSLEDFSNVRRTGIIAIKLNGNDSLKWVKMSYGKDEIIIATMQGQSIRFKESQIRAMGRNTSGVRGIRLKKGDSVASMDLIKDGASKDDRFLVIMEHGYGKQTKISEYRLQSRGGSGIKTANITSKTGKLVSAQIVSTEEEIIAISHKGQTIKTRIAEVRIASRSTQGVKIMTLEASDKVVGITCI